MIRSFLSVAAILLPLIWSEARAESRDDVSLDEFTKLAFRWTGSEERPSLIMSKGTLLAWLRDPATYRGGTNPKWFFNSSPERSMIIVPPGQYMMVFPPRRPVVERTRSDRIQSSRYWLAVTLDGFWGVFDHDATNLYLNESDIQKYLAAEIGPSGELTTFVMGATTTFPFPDGLGALTRGETAHELSRLGGDVVISFDSAFRDMTDKQRQLNERARTSGHPAPTSFHVDEGAVVPIRVSDVVPPEKLTAWASGNLNYKETFESNFSSIRIPLGTSIPFGCGETRKIYTKRESDVSGEVTGEIGAGGSVMTWMTAKLGLSFSAKQDLKKFSENTFEDTSTTSRIYYPVELRQPDGTKALFFAGVARTCAAKRNWHTLVIDRGDKKNWLHSEFWELDKDGKEPEAYSHPTSVRLNAIVPGGDPFSEARGNILARCFRQEQAFEKIAGEEMGEAVAAKVAIAIATVSQAGTVNLSDFFEDRSCNATPAAPLTQTASAGPPASAAPPERADQVAAGVIPPRPPSGRPPPPPSPRAPGTPPRSPPTAGGR